MELAAQLGDAPGGQAVGLRQVLGLVAQCHVLGDAPIAWSQ
jgi:hypothetical protein